MVIAQRFNVGNERPKSISPEGTVDRMHLSSRPFGTGEYRTRAHPTLKRWAIVKNPSGMESKSW
jgi:hypothetical protein